MTDPANLRQGKPTALHQEESARLKKLWDQSKPGSQAEFGEKYGIGNQSAVSHFLNGKSIISLKAAQGFAAGLKCKIEDFSPRIAKLAESLLSATSVSFDEFVSVPHARVEVSAGHGAIVFDEGAESSLSFRRDYLRDQGVSEHNAVVVTVKGSSMEPDITHGAVLLISRAGSGKVKNGQIYAFRLDGELYVKRLHQSSDAIIARSENPDRQAYPDIVIDSKSNDFEIIGRAIWMGRKL